MNIAGKRILITGGSSGIGLALARALATKGARLLLSGRRAEPLTRAVTELRAVGGEVYAVEADVATKVGRDRMIQALQSHFGGLDILVNNAGVVRAGRLEAISEEEIRDMIEVDLIAPMLLVRNTLPFLRQSGDSLIVNIAATGALIGRPFYAPYVAAKAGLVRFGEAMRRELKGEGVHILSVIPGPTDTPMISTVKTEVNVGFDAEPASDVAAAIVDGIEKRLIEVMRGGEAGRSMVELNQQDPGAMDEKFLALKPALEIAVRDHRSL
jgi:short-subunit dehydrogenase